MEELSLLTSVQFKLKTLVRNPQYVELLRISVNPGKWIYACIFQCNHYVFSFFYFLTDSPNGGQSNLSASPDPALDTAELSQEALRLLRVNKIPLSQFAVHVLERSQGRGSEILNKPKTFEQLSEEGREPYRRIKNWLQQEDPIADLRGKITGTWITYEYV